MLRAGIAIDALDALTPSKLTDQIRVAHLASIDARSESVRIGDTTAVVVDETQARWISALCLVRSDFYAESWALHVLHAYYALRLVGCGLPNEARAFGDRLRPEARRLDPDTGFDVSDLHASVARIEHFILGHELGHVAYRGGGDFIEPLVGRVRDCADDLTRLLRVTFTGDRSLLTASEQDPRYEDIVQSVTDYLNRFIFHEFPEDVRAIERGLEVRMQFIKLQARRHRYDVFARIFETVDFIEEAFCDLYALEFQLLDAGTSATRAAEITMHAWQCLHAMFALTALDSLARDRQVAARLCNEVRSILQDVDATSLSDAEVQALSRRVEDIEATRNSDRALLFYQLAGWCLLTRSGASSRGPAVPFWCFRAHVRCRTWPVWSASIEFPTNDQKASISTSSSSRSFTRDSLNASACSCARSSHFRMVSHLWPLISSAPRRLPRRIRISSVRATSSTEVCSPYIAVPYVSPTVFPQSPHCHRALPRLLPLRRTQVLPQ